MPTVTHIFICSSKQQPMVEVQNVWAIAGIGLEGDRYASLQGTYSKATDLDDPSKRAKRNVTLISENLITAANANLSKPFLLNETRRNIVIGGEVDLLSLIGKEFSIGGVRLLGREDCTPCKLPGRLVEKDGFETAFALCGGLRAEILTDGLIRVGDEFC